MKGPRYDFPVCRSEEMINGHNMRDIIVTCIISNALCRSLHREKHIFIDKRKPSHYLHSMFSMWFCLNRIVKGTELAFSQRSLPSSL